MTQENKELLLKDLCSRLPYGVKVSTPDDVSRTITRMNIDRNLIEVGNYIDDVYVLSDIKPYLFPLSSMTEEQIKEWRYTLSSDGNITYDTVDWCNENHLDYRGLIPMGLAIDCTNLNIYQNYDNRTKRPFIKGR